MAGAFGVVLWSEHARVLGDIDVNQDRWSRW